MGFTKPSVQLDWINDDAGSKYTIPSGPTQLAGYTNGTNADAKVFNWFWWRMSQWIEFLDNTYDSNGNEVNAPKSTTITETVAPAASTVTLDAGGIKSWDGSSNAIFSVTEAGAITLGYSGNDIISLSAGALTVGTATAADLVKLHALTPSAADLNTLLGAVGNGLIVADITKLAALTGSAADINVLTGSNSYGLVTGDISKLADIDASAAEIDQLDGNTFGGSSAGDVVTIDDIQTLTNKSIAFSQITSGNVASGVDCGFTGNTSDPATLKFGNMAGYHTNFTSNTDGSIFTIAPSTNNQVDCRLSVTGSSLFKDITAESAVNIILTAGTTIQLNATSTLDFNAATLDIDVSANADITAGSDHYAKICGGTDSAGNNYGAVTVNYSDNGIILINVRENVTTESYTIAPTNFRSGGNADLGLTGSRWGTGYFQNIDVLSSAGDAINITASAGDGLEVDDWAASSAGIHLTLPSLSTTRGQISLDATATAIATKYSNASGGELAAYNNGGTIELWWHDGSSWAKIA